MGVYYDYYIFALFVAQKSAKVAIFSIFANLMRYKYPKKRKLKKVPQ